VYLLFQYWYTGKVPEQYNRKPNVQCMVCKKDIYKRPIEISRNNGNVYCSVTCYGLSCRKEVPCIICGKLILAGANKKTCSRKCSNINRAGIKYKQNRPHDKVISQRQLKLRLIDDRGTICERCGYNKVEILQVHHKNRNRNNNNLENLELICPNCHYEEHLLEKSWLTKYNYERAKEEEIF
jgi:predicted nucleic acid-binding Zn ribbon protein